MHVLTEFFAGLPAWVPLAGLAWLAMIFVVICFYFAAPYDTEIWGNNCNCGTPSSWVIVNANGSERWCGSCKKRLP